MSLWELCKKKMQCFVGLAKLSGTSSRSKLAGIVTHGRRPLLTGRGTRRPHHGCCWERNRFFFFVPALVPASRGFRASLGNWGPSFNPALFALWSAGKKLDWTGSGNCDDDDEPHGRHDPQPKRKSLFQKAHFKARCVKIWVQHWSVSFGLDDLGNAWSPKDL